MTDLSKRLDVASVAIADAKREVLSIWSDGTDNTIVLRGPMWKDSGSWGILAVDLVRHIAAMYAEKTEQDREVVLARIKQVFDAEWSQPTA